MAQDRIITVIGGTGFLGRYVVRELARAGYRIRVIARRPNAAAHLKTIGEVGQVALISGNIADPETLLGKISGSYAVINLAGILFESGKQQFSRVHAQGSEALAKMAKAVGVERFIQVSALGVDKAAGHYAHSKIIGEKAVLAAFPEATILRPSVMFGPEDNFFNQFAAMPVFPLIGGGRTKFQPVYVGDVARATATCLTRDDVKGKTYELGGSRIYSFREILETIVAVTGKPRPFMPMPFGVATAVGAAGEMVGKIWRRPPLTRDQVTLLKSDNVVSPGALTFAHLNIHPTAVDVVVPEYLARFGRYKKAA